MRSKNARQKVSRNATFERFEDRSLMTGTQFSTRTNFIGPADFKIDRTVMAASAATTLSGIQQLASTAHSSTGWTQVAANFGLSGKGQTVAVIDTGIAFNHLALGAGFGSAYRVVGGYDFAENDSNPFDDGPAGSHGTHVAGIIGGKDSASTGVASGVDFVGLRVFDDQGGGYFSWVESALQWVHNNRNSFANPITTVNLSLGADWNAATVPQWAMLEDEFAQLKADGIFIAVAAGNSYADYNTPGLSYPGASPYVVPVMAVDANGQMAGFSQRHSRAIAAPGTGIRSTVPDYLGNGNGIGDDYAHFSGTSMASPYIAGSAALIRQALQVAGTANINQDMIYNLMMNTADAFYDPATQANYKKLNLNRAIETALANDDYGSTMGSAYFVGNFGVGSTFGGSISRISDKDYFQFTATTTGNLTFSGTAAQELSIRWEMTGQNGLTVVNGNSATMNVVAGQTYTIGISTTVGVGRYTVVGSTGGNSAGGNNGGNSSDTTPFAPQSPTNLGTIESLNQSDIDLNGDGWYTVEAKRAGTLTIENLVGNGSVNLVMRVYSSSGQLLASRNVTGNARIDLSVTTGQDLYIQLSGSATDTNLRLTNLVSSGATVTNIYGTSGNDTYVFQISGGTALVANGVLYTFGSTLTNFNFNGSSGQDAITMTGSSGADTITMRPGSAVLSTGRITAGAVNIENITISGMGGDDRASFYDSNGNDTFYATSGFSRMAGTNYINVTNGIKNVNAYASGGFDIATFQDSAGNDTYTANPTSAQFLSSGAVLTAYNFNSTQAYSTRGGYDTATLVDSSGNDRFSAGKQHSIVMGSSFYNRAYMFNKVTADGKNGGYDLAYFFDSIGNDTYTLSSASAEYRGGNFWNVAKNFEFSSVWSSAGGYDTANIFDDYGSDDFEVDGSLGKFSGNGYYAWLHDIEKVNLDGTKGGNNTVINRSAAEFVFNKIGSWN